MAISWARGFLLDEYDIKTTDVGWFVSGKEVYIANELPVKVERLDPSPPFGQEKEHLAKLLGEGKLAAALVAGDSGYPGLFGGGVLPGIMKRKIAGYLRFWRPTFLFWHLGASCPICEHEKKSSSCWFSPL